MKKFWLLLFLTPLLLGSSSSSSSLKVKFYQGSLTSAKTQAAKEGKLYFVEFMASWCEPCRWMDETTFTNTQLADYIHQNYVAVKVNIDDFDGYAYKQLYDIKLLPSFLIFNSKGELLDQYAESLSAARLLSILKKYNVPANRGIQADTIRPPLAIIESHEELTPANDTRIVEPEIPVVSYDITSEPTQVGIPPAPGLPPSKMTPSPNENALFADEIEQESIAQEAEESYYEASPSMDQSMEPGTGLYRFSVTRQASSGYSLQTGVYAAYENVLLEAAKLEDNYEEYPIIVHIAAINGKRVYRVMLGEFPQKRDAIQFKRQMERYGVEGLVKGLASL